MPERQDLGTGGGRSACHSGENHASSALQLECLAGREQGRPRRDDIVDDDHVSPPELRSGDERRPAEPFGASLSRLGG